MADLLGAPKRDEILREMARELQMRRAVFPKWIDAGKLKPDEAKRRIDRLQAGYDFIMHNMPE